MITCASKMFRIGSSHLSLLTVFHLILAFSFHLVASDMLPTCQANDFKYDFTECDMFGGRWRVSVPISPGHCIGGTPNAPLRVNKCFSSCDGGQFFNMTNLLCEECKPGSFSLGGGIIFDAFNTSTGQLPSGFHIVTESTKHTPELDKKCTGWYVDPVTNNLVSSMSTRGNSQDFGFGCVSAVTYTARVVKSGRLRFTYHYQTPDDLASSILFTFHYRIYDENGFLDDDMNTNIKFPATTINQNFETVEVLLTTPGLYIFTWKSVLIGNFRSILATSHNFGVLPGKYGSVYSDDEHSSIDNFSSGWSGNRSGLPPGIIRVKRIIIEGVAYASECTACEPGTYAPKHGMRECVPCLPDTFNSDFGAIQCTPCDLLTQYAPEGSAHCLRRPICGPNDLYTVPKGKCDKGKQEVEYKWIEPRICVDSNHIFPTKSDYINCSSLDDFSNQCDLGMELKSIDNGHFCQFCGENFYRNNESLECKPCPPLSQPYYALTIEHWNNTLLGWSAPLSLSNSVVLQEDYFADNSAYVNGYFSRQCMLDDYENPAEIGNEVKSSQCTGKVAWQPFHHYIRTGASAQLNAFLILSITIPAFRSKSGGEIYFVFELTCDTSDACSFLFVETRNDESDIQAPDVASKEASAKRKFMSMAQPTVNQIIKEWDQSSNGRVSFRYKIERNISATYSWVFKRVHSYQSHAKLYSLTVLNSFVGSAIRCNSCRALSETSSNCISCPDNNYFESTELTNEKISSGDKEASGRFQCKPCPVNHVLNASISMPFGIQSCIPCGPNLITDNQTNTCYGSCLVSFGQDHYDLRELHQPIHYNGVNLFTAGGTQYLHLFKLTLCGDRKHVSLSTCLNNITAFREESNLSSGIRSFICRSTIIPDGSHIYSTQSVSLGDELIAITREITFQNITVHSEFVKSPEANRFDQDFHLFFLTKVTTSACPQGRRLTITMRCKPELSKTHPGKAVISTPKACPDGTCDGCNFHLLIETATAAACRLCRAYSNDYETVAGECIDGIQQVHYLNPKACVIKPVHDLNGGQPSYVITRVCTVLLPRQIQLGITIIILLGVLLLLLVFYFWNKNRSLEYKYTMLIESTGEGKAGEEMSLDNCCVDDEDEEDSSTRHTNQSSSISQLMFASDTTHRKAITNRADKAASKLMTTSQEMQQLFKGESPTRIRGKAVDEGYETIHLTSASNSANVNQIV